MKSQAALIFLVLAAHADVQSGEGIEVGEEFIFPADRSGKGIGATPAVAYGRDAYLVVWREGWPGKGPSARIRAARVSPDGRVLDPDGIPVSARPGMEERPRVAFGGGVFLVVWQGAPDGRQCDILAARVSPEGRVLDPRPIRVAAGPRSEVLPDVAGDGENFLAVWQGLAGEETSFRGLAAPLSAGGEVGRTVETGMTPQQKVAWSGTAYLSAGGGAGFWAGNVQTVRLDAFGRPIGKPVLALRGTKAAVFSVCPAPGGGWLIVSHRSPPDPWGWGGPGAMRAVRIGPDGHPENRDGIDEPSGVKDRLPGWLDLGGRRDAGSTWPWGESAGAFDGARVVAVWQRHDLGGEKKTEFTDCDLVAARVDGFRSLDPDGVPAAAGPLEERRPALASDSRGGLLLVYEERGPGGTSRVAGRLLRTR